MNEINFLSVFSNVFGNPLIFLLIAILLITAFLFFIRASKEVFIGFLFIILIGSSSSGFIPAWVLGVVLIILGLFLSNIIIKTFFRGGN
jgi:hypothetical protein